MVAAVAVSAVCLRDGADPGPETGKALLAAPVGPKAGTGGAWLLPGCGSTAAAPSRRARLEVPRPEQRRAAANRSGRAPPCWLARRFLIAGVGGQGGGDGGPRDAVASYSRLLPPWKARALVPASIVCGAALADFDQVRIAGRPQRGLGLRQQLGALACRAWQGGCSVLGQA